MFVSIYIKKNNVQYCNVMTYTKLCTGEYWGTDRGSCLMMSKGVPQRTGCMGNKGVIVISGWLAVVAGGLGAVEVLVVLGFAEDVAVVVVVGLVVVLEEVVVAGDFGREVLSRKCGDQDTPNGRRGIGYIVCWLLEMFLSNGLYTVKSLLWCSTSMYCSAKI